MKRLQGVCFALCFGYVQNTLALFCPSGQFALKHQCVGCHPTCWECNGHELFECTKCGVDEDGQEHFFHRGRCRLHCPRGFYPEQDRFTCEPCMVNCELCADAKVCTKCTGNYKLQSGVCQTTECKEGQVEDPETGECIDCETGCETCSAGDPELCKSCMEGYFLYRHQCRRGCPQKTYGDEGRKMCFSCPTPCIDCRSDSLCLSCQAGHYLSDGSCVKQCPDGTYGEPNSWRCESCHGSCQTCYGSLPKNCDSCPHGNLPMYGQCPTVSCVEGQYMDAADSKCYSCDVSCKTCFGPQALDCSSCCTGYFLDQEGACVEHCPVGYFINPATQLCEECSANCESCEGAPEKCLSCKKGPFSLFLHQGNCWSNCPEGYFESAEGTCEACDSLCLSCDENKSNCMSCAAGLYLENGRCSPNCSVKYYPDMDGTCRRCPAHCHTCTDGKTCKACSYLYLLLNGVCKATCPKGYFEDLDQGKCIACHSTCASCSGTQHDDCDSCSSLYPRLYEGQCSVECPAGTYYESSAKECQECDRTCAGCTGPELTDCTKCKEGLALDPDTMMCGVTGDSNCPPKTFLHDDQFTCMACHKQCESCNGPNANDCQTCALPNYLYNGTCLRVCSAGTFESSEEADGVELGFCSACDHVCATCTGASPKDCTTCSSGYFKFMRLCVLHCPAGYYRGTTRCEKCDPSCRLCSGPGPQACLSCPPHMLQLDGTRQCVEHCPERFYQENDKCKQCHTSCKTCKDYTPQGCLTCDWGSTLQNGICYPRCEEQSYLSEDEVCKLCDSSCRHCSGPGPNQCVSCKPNFALHPTEKRCIECCESEVNQTDCCLCTTNSALCVERPHPEPERRLMSENMNSLAISHVSATVPALVMLVLVITLAVLGLYRARARQKLCWKLSYERLSGSADPNASYRRDMLHGVPDPDDSADEADVVYTSRDGTVYRRYNFIKAQDEEAEGHEDQAAYLNKARC
ncbi:proprotein convertase subtilisin/kexin type 5-like isoform X1 [Huso huso]|uniref:Proprotein convertase subtilisin/kexin type 5-like isoform X1 n=1 Tax=Huso huso TaxID=61971 RepID=A0ABR0YS99_HUSHU